MAAILTAAEMRALEAAAIESGAVTGLELMERAGRGVVEAILAEWPDAAEGPQRAVVLCGPGNNGGDGFVVARLLKERGWEVEAFLFGDPARLPPDARRAHDVWVALAGPVEATLATDDWGITEGPVGSVFSRDDDTCYFVDALFGTGLTRGSDLAFSVWQDLSIWPHENVEVRMVAVDVPSGLCADSGRALVPKGLEDRTAVIPADLTVTFASLKPGHLLADGPGLCGKIVVADIGLAPPIRTGGLEEVHLGAPSGWLRRKLAKQAGHKYGYGHVVVLAGGAGHGGAARLAARGALRIGAGLVTLDVPPAALQENATRLDAIMLRSVKDAEALTAHLRDLRLSVLCAGPGFGTGERQGAMLHAMLDLLGVEWRENEEAYADYKRALYAPNPSGGLGDREAVVEALKRRRPNRHVVLDADALTLLSKDPALRAKLHGSCVLTPHEGEFARLFPAIDARWRAPATTGPAPSKVDAAREAAREAGCVVLLKGPDTVIADPSGRAAINAAVYDRAAPWLATAGSGDVLAGFIAGLLARGFAPFDAACTAAWLHVECARSFGPGLIAEDLPEELPKVFRSLGL